MVAPVSPGDVIGGKYRVERVLGEGGMGVVVAAMHVALRERVAIKFLRVSNDPDGASRRRFAREARASVKLKNEHVVRVLDFGVFEAETPAIVMEFLEGEDLSQALARAGPLDIQAAVEYVLQACEGIAEAHRHGIVHRDLKPSNLFLARAIDGAAVVKVLDFGISKLLRQDDESQAMLPITKTNAVVGSPTYMAPEQLSGTPVDARADIWGMGTILYELLTGKVPFEAKAPALLFTAILTRDPPPPRTLRPDVPAELEQVVLRCLAKDPDERFRTVREFAEALIATGTPNISTRHSLERISRYYASDPPHVSDPPDQQPSPELARTDDLLSLTAWKRTSLAEGRNRKRRWTIAVALALVTLALGALAVGLLVTPNTAAETAPSAQPAGSTAAEPHGDAAVPSVEPAAVSSTADVAPDVLVAPSASESVAQPSVPRRPAGTVSTARRPGKDSGSPPMATTNTQPPPALTERE